MSLKFYLRLIISSGLVIAGFSWVVSMIVVWAEVDPKDPTTQYHSIGEYLAMSLHYTEYIGMFFGSVAAVGIAIIFFIDQFND